MKKPFRHTDLSNKTCACGKRIKKNLLFKKPDADQCFKCWYPAEITRRGGTAFTGRKDRVQPC